MSKRPRTEDYGIVFGGPAKTAVGWAIPVPEAFQARLDILFTPRKGGHRLTQGQPPQYSFASGDVLYDPPEVRNLRWGDALPIMRRMVKVDDAVSDALDGREVRSGTVTFRLSFHADGREIKALHHKVTQRGFVAFLRDGEIPKDEDLSDGPISIPDGEEAPELVLSTSNK